MCLPHTHCADPLAPHAHRSAHYHLTPTHATGPVVDDCWMEPVTVGGCLPGVTRAPAHYRAAFTTTGYEWIRGVWRDSHHHPSVDQALVPGQTPQRCRLPFSPTRCTHTLHAAREHSGCERGGRTRGRGVTALRAARYRATPPATFSPTCTTAYTPYTLRPTPTLPHLCLRGGRCRVAIPTTMEQAYDHTATRLPLPLPPVRMPPHPPTRYHPHPPRTPVLHAAARRSRPARTPATACCAHL